MWRGLVPLAVIAISLVMAHADVEDESGRLLGQEEAYAASAKASLDDTTDLIQTGESAAAPATPPPKSKQVKIVGDTSILATMRMFAEGDNLLQVTDSSTGYGMRFGTNSKQKDHIRMRPTKGKGIAINSKGDKVGLFVDAASGYVGVGHSAPKAHLHVKGTMYSTGTITTTATGNTAALQLSGVSDFHGIQLNKDGKNLFLIGRGKGLAEREMSFHVPSAADYGGGKEPKFKWVSGSAHETLAHLEASSGNMYVKGRVGIGAIQPKAAMDIRGALNIENANAEAVITFPRGKSTGFHIRSTNNPGTYTSADDRLYIKGSNGFVGVQTTKPKAMLDVRGALNLQDASSAAVIYFPSKGASSSFFIRCADNPSQYSEEQERLYIGANGKVGIGTNKPTHGLTVSSAAGQGSPLNDIAIMKGSLRVSGGIYDTFGGGKKYFIDMKKKSFLKTVNVEKMLGVGTAKPKGLPGSDAAVHIQGKAPVLRIENLKPAGSAVVSLQTGGNTWDMQGTGAAMTWKNNGKARLTITNDGNIGIGERATNPTHGLTIETNAPRGNKRNDLSIRKGHLWLWGSIKQIGNPKYSFSMAKGGLVKHINVEGNLGIGMMGKKPKFALQLGKGQTVSIGNQMFFAGENGNAYLSSNVYRTGGKWSLHKRNAGGAALLIENTGTIKLSGTRKLGNPRLETMFTVSAKTQTAAFPMAGMKAGFGTMNPQYPLQVNGAVSVGDTKASIAFGMSETSMGYLGSNSEYVYIATKTGKEALAVDHNTGYVGIGTPKPQSMLHLSSSSGPALSFGSSTANKATHAYIKAAPAGNGLNMVFGIKNPTKSGGKLTFDFKNEIKFGGSGSTVFARGDTLFKTGNVGIGGSAFDPKFKLHVKGDMQVDGKCFVATRKPGTVAKGATKKKASKTTKKKKGKEELEMNELDFTDLLEQDEGLTDNVSEHGIDLGETLHGLARVLRKQHNQMNMHDKRITQLSEQMAAMSR
jgi:hypothetical protein